MHLEVELWVVEDVVDDVFEGLSGLQLSEEWACGIVEDIVGAERTAERDVLGRARDGDVGANGFGDLDAKGADAAAAAVDEDAGTSGDVGDL